MTNATAPAPGCAGLLQAGVGRQALLLGRVEVLRVRALGGEAEVAHGHRDQRLAVREDDRVAHERVLDLLGRPALEAPELDVVAVDDVDAVAAVDVADVEAAPDRVVAAAAADRVRAAAGDDLVVLALAVEHVAAAAALDDVAAGAAVEHVVAVVADEDVVAVAAVHRACRCRGWSGCSRRRGRRR